MKAVTVVATLFAVVLVGRPIALAGQKPPHPPHPSHPATPNKGSHGKPANTGAASHTPSSVPKNPKLVAKVQPMLPGGMSVEQAAAGFSNQGQFLAAVHVSHNLDIPFNEVKTKALSDGGSLGSAIHSLKPSADAKARTRSARINRPATISRTSAGVMAAQLIPWGVGLALCLTVVPVVDATPPR